MNTRRRGIAVTGAVMAVALMGACGGEARETSPASGDVASAYSSSRSKMAGAAEAPTAPATTEAAPAIQQRALIYTGELSVRVDKARDVAATAARAVAIVTAAGGYVGGDERQTVPDNTRVQLQLRLPANRFMTTVDQLGKIGSREEDRHLSTEDVTEQTVDLATRIASQRASVVRTRALLAQAKTVTELVTVEGELAKRESALASLEGQQKRLADSTSLSTVTLTILGPQAAAEPTTGFRGGLHAGWSAFTHSLQTLVTVLGAMLPWLVLLAFPLLGAAWLVRRRRSRS